MSRSHSVGITEDPGRIEDEQVACSDCPAHDADEAVYRIPDPRYSIGTVTALCAYHLAVIEREHPLHWSQLRDHPEISGLATAAQDHALVERDDVPAEITVDCDLYQRLGLDEKGRAYFVVELGNGDYRVIETDERFDVLESTVVSRERLTDLFDHVEERVGWRGIDGDWIDLAQDNRGAQS